MVKPAQPTAPLTRCFPPTVDEIPRAADDARMSRLAVTLLIVLALSVATSLSVILIQQRSISSLRAENAQLRQNPNASAGAGSDAKLPGVTESDVLGRYRWIEGGKELSTIELLADHSMHGPNNTKNVRCRWFLQWQGLVITWPKSYGLFTESPAPGSYTGFDNRKSVLIEKMQ